MLFKIKTTYGHCHLKLRGIDSKVFKGKSLIRTPFSNPHIMLHIHLHLVKLPIPKQNHSP